MDESSSERPTFAMPERPSAGGSPPSDPPRRRSVFPWLLAASALAFSLGLIANPWFERNVRAYLPGSMQEDAAPQLPTDLSGRIDAQARALAALEARVANLEARPAEETAAAQPPQPALNDGLAAAPAPGGSTGAADERMARVETRLDALNQQQLSTDQRVDNLAAEVGGLTVKVNEIGNRAAASVQAAAEGAGRAQAILLITSTRRAIESGNRLGALEPALRAQFGATHSPAVEAVIALGQQPVTLRRLQRDFARLRPALVGSGEDSTRARSWWEEFKEGLAGIVSVRRTGAPVAATDPAARVDQAARQLASGDVAGAITSVSHLPPSSRQLAADWLDNARRFVAGARGLAQLETMTLTAPPPVAAPVAPPTVPPTMPPTTPLAAPSAPAPATTL